MIGICVIHSYIDDEVKKEKQHLKALNTEKELARRDDLTGVKNKTAYNEMEKSVQEGIDSGMKDLSLLRAWLNTSPGPTARYLGYLTEPTMKCTKISSGSRTREALSDALPHEGLCQFIL